MSRWYDLPFQMMESGPYWIPPRCRSKNRNNEVLQEQASKGQKKTASQLKSNTNANRSNENVVRVKESLPPTKAGRFGSAGKEKPLTARPLSKVNRQKFIQELRQLKPMRKAVRASMVFCMENAEMAAEIVEILSEALCTTYPNTEKKLARIYLINDILQNSKTSLTKNAAAYQTEFKKSLPQILGSLRQLSVALKNAEKILFDKKINKLLDIWESGTFFTGQFLERLRSTFHGKKVPKGPVRKPLIASKGRHAGRPPTISLRPVRRPEKHVRRETLAVVDGLSMDDLDGAPMDDVDGLPMDEMDGVPM